MKWSQNFEVAQIAKQTLERTEVAFDRAVQKEQREMIRRTQAGRDIKDVPFAKYSDAYFEWKRSKGRAGNVDLTFTGIMLSSITSRIERLGNKFVTTIFFTSAGEAAKARGNQERRRFFGLAEVQIRRITQAIKDALNER